MDATEFWASDSPSKLVGRVVHRHFQMGRFDAFPDLDSDDVTQELVTWAFSERHKFDPMKACLSTWLTMFASRRIHNVRRDRGRGATCEAKYAENSQTFRQPDHFFDPPEDPDDIVEGQVLGSSDGQTFPEWCEATRLNARAIYRNRRCEVNGREYLVASIAAASLLIARLGLSGLSVWWVLKQRPDLQRSLGFDFMPSRQFVNDAAEFVNRKDRAVSEAMGRPPKDKREAATAAA